MGIRSKAGGKRRAQATTPSTSAQTETRQANPPQGDGGGAGSSGDAAPATMRKGVYLSALVYVEGEQAPADDFVSAAKAALTEALSSKTSSGYKLTLKKAQAQNDVEQDDGGKGDDGKAAAKEESKPKSDFEF